uniref:Uncharacterized protein AlNc14C330G10685 n=1 Tax=Albugo laibachii Nc14 TaxID=890382 RepID=F0WWS1_9STRA|nr:conserved hypothetical protein [Albugo laibachii Nc14]|eukprot:CCA25898.1 conserved hypothetical protein [Albugo laibachii Nc14]
MAQGATYLKCKKKVANASIRPVAKKIQYRHKKSAAKFKKKGNPTKEIRRGCNGFKKCGDKSVTALINNNIEEVMATRVLQSGTSLSMNDISANGKERLREINRNARTKKKNRVLQKLNALEQTIDQQEER